MGEGQQQGQGHVTPRHATPRPGVRGRSGSPSASSPERLLRLLAKEESGEAARRWGHDPGTRTQSPGVAAAAAAGEARGRGSPPPPRARRRPRLPLRGPKGSRAQTRGGGGPSVCLDCCRPVPCAPRPGRSLGWIAYQRLCSPPAAARWRNSPSAGPAAAATPASASASLLLQRAAASSSSSKGGAAGGLLQCIAALTLPFPRRGAEKQQAPTDRAGCSPESQPDAAIPAQAGCFREFFWVPARRRGRCGLQSLQSQEAPGQGLIESCA